MRGWSWNIIICISTLQICPAYAGMILNDTASSDKTKNLSRVCGDDPKLGPLILMYSTFVPRMRGWSHRFYYMSNYILICPAYAGMILLTLLWILQEKNLSRVCGDDPKSCLFILALFKFVPRMRGWSSSPLNTRLKLLICPAYAGMILSNNLFNDDLLDLSRVCGDDPSPKGDPINYIEFVPRMRGWSRWNKGREV